ncbi:hypothetical protein ACFL1Y_00210 [Patescibacteria group bacterium]
MPYTTLFPGQEADEKIILVLHRHPFVFLKVLLMYILLLGVPIVISTYITSYTEWEINQSLNVILSLTTSLYYIFILTFLYRAWLDHYLDIWVITSERVVNIEQKGLFSRNISSQKLYRVQDVTADVKGILPTFLHYGNVFVQTAGTKQNFIFKNIPNPYDVTKKLMTLVNWKKGEVDKNKE